MSVTPRIARARGFTYLGVLFAVAFMGVALALAGQLWSTLDRRAKERQLLFIGAQFRDALTRYYVGAPPGTPRQFPTTLDELLRDRRYPGIRRYLRRIYADPLTGKAEWGFVKGPRGEITGVYSQAAGVPIKIANFGDDFPFAGARSYADWIFIAAVEEPAAADVASPAVGALNPAAAMEGARPPTRAAGP